MLATRNVRIDGRRTSVRMERAFWEALDAICEHESVTPAQLCAALERRRGDASRAAALRAFVVGYLAARAPEHG